MRCPIRGTPSVPASQHSLTFTEICTANPPSDVSLYFVSMSRAVCHIERITASSDT